MQRLQLHADKPYSAAFASTYLSHGSQYHAPLALGIALLLDDIVAVCVGPLLPTLLI